MAKKLFLVLVATSIEGVGYAAGSVINIEKSVGDEYARAGALDGAPAATKYARDNGAETMDHVPAEPDAAAVAAAAEAVRAEQIAALEAEIAAAADADKPALQAELDKLKAE